MSRIGCLMIALLGAPMFAADKPTPQQIESAIKDLGAKTFTAREKAAKLLWEAGADAEEALRVAANSPDAETARRARTILDKFDWGIFPDTPEPVVEQITLFRNGDRNARIQCVTKLMALGKPGYSALKRLAEMEPDANNKQALFAQMAQEAQRVLPGLLAAGDIPAVEDMLDRSLLAGSEDNFTSYAAFQALTNKLPQALARWEQDYAKSKSATAGMVIVHLLRAMGKFEPAREWAKKLKNDSLVEQLLWEEGNWKELSERLKNSPTEKGDATGIGLRAAVHRLAGDKTTFDLAIAKLVK